MIKLSSIKSNPLNPRIIKDDAFMLLVKSIKEFPVMLAARPVVINEDNMIMGGNQRFKALLHLECKEVPDEWIKKVSDFTPDQWQEFMIKDNVSFGQWNWDDLNTEEWNNEKLQEWGLELQNTNEDSKNSEDPKDIGSKIETKFMIEVTCISEREQEKFYNECINQGYKCRILTL